MPLFESQCSKTGNNGGERGVTCNGDVMPLRVYICDFSLNGEWLSSHMDGDKTNTCSITGTNFMCQFHEHYKNTTDIPNLIV